MEDSECVQFLQWAIPRLHMRWPGFRKVRAQVCKRITRRMHQLHIDRVADYRAYLEEHPQEWEVLDTLSRVTISRFYRDKAMFAYLENDVLPALAEQTTDRRQESLRVWSAGSSSGEEPYTIALVWILRLQSIFPRLRLEIIATDTDPNMIRRANAACYLYSSIKNLPADWCEQAFVKQDEQFCLKSEYSRDVRISEQDVRMEMPGGQFDLVMCRNLVFTYFEEAQQRQILDRMLDGIQSGGALVIGIHEELPEDTKGFRLWSDRLRIFRKNSEERDASLINASRQSTVAI